MERSDLPEVRVLLKDVADNTDSMALDIYFTEPSGNRFATCLVAERHGEVVGVVGGVGLNLTLAGLGVSDMEIARRIRLLDFLAVRPADRGAGLGTLLTTTLLDQFLGDGARLAVTYLAPGRHELVPVYTGWGWTIGLRGAGLPIQIGSDPLVIGDEPALRTAWKALAPGVRATSLPGIRVPVVTGAA
ncbi:GNAT family N-acetyltransferase [Streptomyces sp. DH7]|uniref:GNAT family N-acetyltransferase n=1 Tax=Streptomyces sp. DH7 TaxID=2857006 RepID=UPI001E4BF34E|nr:GNAT family N-acetyltransferase [Streptomyces sp. DH7]